MMNLQILRLDMIPGALRCTARDIDTDTEFTREFVRPTSTDALEAECVSLMTKYIESSTPAEEAHAALMSLAAAKVAREAEESRVAAATAARIAENDRVESLRVDGEKLDAEIAAKRDESSKLDAEIAAKRQQADAAVAADAAVVAVTK